MTLLIGIKELLAEYREAYSLYDEQATAIKLVERYGDAIVAALEAGQDMRGSLFVKDSEGHDAMDDWDAACSTNEGPKEDV
jgi:hypothetical protein